MKIILREEYGEVLDMDKVESIGEKLVSLYEVILQPEVKEVT